MLGGISGIDRFLGLVADLVRRMLQVRRQKETQGSYEAIERDPAGEFVDRYGVRGDGDDSGTAAQADPGERPDQ